MAELTVDRPAPGTAPAVSRPAPVGVFPLPFGYLLLPPGADGDAVAELLRRGRLPQTWPSSLTGHRLAHEGELEAARDAFSGTDAVSRYNRFVIDPGDEDPSQLQQELGPELAPLVDVVRYTLGHTDTPPALGATEGEVAALVLAAHAADALGRDDPDAAVDRLQAALAAVPADLPALAGVLHGAIAPLQRQSGDVTGAIGSLQTGLKSLADTDLDVARAEQHLELAATFHELAGEQRELLTKAIYHYHSALQAITETDEPELFASAHVNLAAAYLTMPMTEASDQLRVGVAVGSLRAALRVYTQQTHPVQWASAQLNLANALVYAPSAKRADNLVEAAEIYESLLGARNRTDDPLGYARVLANQGNVLAHLGMLDQAWGKLVEARFLFEEFHEYDAVTTVRGLLDEIKRAQGQAQAEVPS